MLAEHPMLAFEKEVERAIAKGDPEGLGEERVRRHPPFGLTAPVVYEAIFRAPWPLTARAISVRSWRMPYVRAFAVHCDRCSAAVSFNTTDRHDAAAQLRTAGWLPCPRKGGKLTGMCPRCRPPADISTMATRSTPDMGAVSDDAAAAAVLWSVRRLLPPARVVTFRAIGGAFCITCGNERDACEC